MPLSPKKWYPKQATPPLQRYFLPALRNLIFKYTLLKIKTVYCLHVALKYELLS